MPVVSSFAKFIDYLHRLKVVLFILVAALAIFAFPAQTLELYIIYAQAVEAIWRGAGAATDAVGQSANVAVMRQFVAGLLGTALLSGLIWVSTLRLLMINRTDQDINEEPPRRHLVMAAIGAVLPVIALYSGFAKSLANATSGKAEDAIVNTIDRNGLLDVTALALLMLVIALLGLAHALLKGRMTPFVSRIYSRTGFIVVWILIAIIVALCLKAPVAVPEALGTLAVVTVFLSLLCYVLTSFAAINRFHGIPVTPVLIIAGFLLAMAGLNDNHRVDAYAIRDIEQPERASLQSQYSPEVATFFAWLEGRKDRDGFVAAGKPYPVYLVTAEGGGLYAAFNAASFLARMQDECPSFAQHTFAMSSVSGGSLGASVFAALAANRAENAAYRPCQPKGTASRDFTTFTDTYFRGDFLSPLVASLLFPDLIQRIIPAPIHEFDRARALERSFEAAWENAAGSLWPKPEDRPANPFEGYMSAIGSATAAAPYLMLNATSVTLGPRVTMSPMRLTSTASANHISEALLGYDEAQQRTVDMRLSAAVSLSARFPWVTPAGWLDRCRSEGAPRTCAPEQSDYGNRLYLADGGYFENSGIEAVVELADRLRQALANRETVPKGLPDVDIKIIHIAAYDQFAARWWSPWFALSRSSNGELMAPFDTLQNSRVARTLGVWDKTMQDGVMNETWIGYAKEPAHKFTPAFHRVTLDGTTMFLPLGWHLSTTTRDRIASGKGFWPRFSACRIRRELMHEADEFDWADNGGPCAAAAAVSDPPG